MIWHEANYDGLVQLRYSFRLYPTPGQCIALAKAFGCARVVFNDALAARQAAYVAGLPYVTDAALSARLTAAKATPERAWLSEVSAVGMLEYKARLYGRTFIRIGRFEPTSRTCSACGIKDGPKPLHVRAWQCPACETWLDRDINAAVNVARAAGLAVTACGAQVRPGAPPLAQRSEAGTLRGAA